MSGARAPSNPGSSETVRRRVRVLNRLGLHARPATVLSSRAREFRCEIRIRSLAAGSAPAAAVDAKNLLDVLFLAAPEGAELEVECLGADAAEAAEAIARMFAERFGTEP